MPPRVRRQARRPAGRVIKDLDPYRFVAGARIIGVVGQPVLTGIHVDVVRPDDLLQLGCTFVDCDLVTGGANGPSIVPRKGEHGLLVVEFAFQHAHEEAIYEQQPAGQSYVAVDDGKGGKAPGKDPNQANLQQPGATTRPGVGFIPARKSRLAFDLGGAAVPFSTAGILAVMQGPLNLAARAAPNGIAPSNSASKPGRKLVGTLIGDSPVIQLGNGLIAELRDSGPVILNATGRFLRSNPAPDTSTAAGAQEVQRNLARLRVASRRTSPVVLAGTTVPEGSVLEPGRGWTVPEVVIGATRFPRADLSEPPGPTETAIEAPFRLVISPSSDGRFTHATDPVRADDAPGNVELWHTRLASTPKTPGGDPNEDDQTHRIIRALWARDRDWTGSQWKSGDETSLSFPEELRHPATIAAAKPFLGSLDGLDRHMLVRQTSETWKPKVALIPPTPVGADALWLSALGAWLDLHGEWDTMPYSRDGLQSILDWDHLAPMGRDQYVRVVYPGYLYPFGHRCALVKVTERKMKTTTPDASYAGLYQRMFLVVGQRTRTYGERRLPFSSLDVRPLVTPPIDFPGGGTFDESTGTITQGISTVIWPHVGGQDFVWNLDTVDHDGQSGKLHMPLMWVNEAFHGPAPKNKKGKDDSVDAFYLGDHRRVTDGLGQNIAFVPKVVGKPDSRVEARRLYFRGAARLGASDPTLTAAEVVLPAVQRLSPTESLAISYRDQYVKSGLTGQGTVWAKVLEGPGGASGAADPTSEPTALGFGGGGAGSDKAGGFLSPNVPIRALSVDTGPVGDAESAVNGNLTSPQAFLDGAFPKLFGLIDLIDLLVENGALPAVVTDTLGQAARFVKDVQQLETLLQDAVKEAQQLEARAQQKSSELQAAAAQTVTKVNDAVSKINALVTAAENLVPGPGPAATRAQDVFDAATALLPPVRTAAPMLPPLIRDALLRYAGIIEAVTADLGTLTALIDAVEKLTEAQELTFHFDWRPQLHDWPSSASIFTLDPDSKTDHLVLSVDGRVSASGQSEVSVAAELRDFALTLFGTDSLMRVPFDHLSFKAGTGGKPEIDVVLGEIEFLGLLSFVETIKDLIPLDGFSDPPYMEVSSEGAKAGFTLALPSVAIGVFNLANMSLGADVSIPFIGKTVTVGFNFCTRERPFTLTVMCLGGGGWFLIRVAPDGLDLLEVGLEATACLAVDLGVASGSISASIGLYIRLEGEKGSLTGYFRLRGEVDVLGLISASIELYMELVYQFDTGKMIGRATITVQVHVLFFSGSVEVSAERQFAGSNGDPSFREVLGAESGSSPLWNDYAAAFAAESA